MTVFSIAEPENAAQTTAASSDWPSDCGRQSAADGSNYQNWRAWSAPTWHRGSRGRQRALCDRSKKKSPAHRRAQFRRRGLAHPVSFGG